MIDLIRSQRKQLLVDYTCSLKLKSDLIIRFFERTYISPLAPS